MYSEFLVNNNFSKKFANEMNATRSDKSKFHHYEGIYSHLLTNITVKNFLEIGCFMLGSSRSSLYGWQNVLTDANIYGADIQRQLLFNTDRVTTVYLDQSDPTSFKNLYDLNISFDVIVDDGSHIFELTKQTYSMLSGLLTEGGVYIIEDIHETVWNKHPKKQTVMQIKNWLDSLNVNYSLYKSYDPDQTYNYDEYGPFPSIIVCIKNA